MFYRSKPGQYQKMPYRACGSWKTRGLTWRKCNSKKSDRTTQCLLIRKEKKIKFEFSSGVYFEKHYLICGTYLEFVVYLTGMKNDRLETKCLREG